MKQRPWHKPQHAPEEADGPADEQPQTEGTPHADEPAQEEATAAPDSEPDDAHDKTNGADQHNDQPLLVPDRQALACFADIMFRYARPDGYISLRAFPGKSNGGKKEKPIFIESIQIGDSDFLDIATERARQAATWPAPAVFAPPVATFKNGRDAKGDNLDEGVGISTECDQTPQTARATLEALLGAATVVVESGGQWVDPPPAGGRRRRPDDRDHLHRRRRQGTARAARAREPGAARLHHAGALTTFADRRDAGEQLATHLAQFDNGRPVALGLPRGGVVVAAAIAAARGWPLDVLLVRKVGVPRQPELAMGAIGELGAQVVNDRVMSWTAATEEDFARVAATERVELERRAELYRGGRPPLDLRDRTAVAVDDGIATGATAAAAISVARHFGADRVVLAVPVAPPDAVERFQSLVDELVVLVTPEHFSAVGEWYRNFDQTTDSEVVELLERHRPAAPQA